MTRNRLADSPNEGLRSQQAGSSSLYNAVDNTFRIIQPGKCRWWQRAGSSSSSFTQSITRTPHFGHGLSDVTITLGIKHFIECTCSNLPNTTTVNKISVLNLGHKGSCSVSNYLSLFPYSTATIQDNITKLRSRLSIATSPFLLCQLK